MDDDAPRARQRSVTGKASLKQFTKGDAAVFIDHLIKTLGAPKPRRARTRPQKLPENVVPFITPRQRRKIEVMASQALVRKVGWHVQSEVYTM